ncbi:MAG: ATP-binding cassette domain-containing protein [Synergistaceae bacterium]
MSIVVKELYHTYNMGLPTEVTALSGVSLSIERGEIVSVVGLMGSGKSTLAQHLNGLLFVQRGSVSVDGCDVTAKTVFTNEIRRKVGYVFQYPEQQIFSETVEKEISFAPSNWGVTGSELKTRIKESLSTVGLDENVLTKNPFTLSSGIKRRVAIASVIAATPDFIVLDEPNAGLDARGTEELINLMKTQADQGVGIVHITHDLTLALSISDKILVLDEGKSISWGTPKKTAELLCLEHLIKLPLPDILNLSNILKKRGKVNQVTLNPYELASMISERE